MIRKISGYSGVFLLALFLMLPSLYAKKKSQADDLNVDILALQSSAADAEAMLQSLMDEQGELKSSTDMSALLKAATDADTVLKTSSDKLDASPAASTETSTSAAATAEDQLEEGTMARDPFASRLDDGPDALIPMDVGGAPAPMIVVKLDGLGFGGQKGYAILNGTVYREGENKAGIKLLEVKRREVDIMVSGTIRNLKLFSDEHLERLQKRREEKTGVSAQPLEKRKNNLESFPGRESSIS